MKKCKNCGRTEYSHWSGYDTIRCYIDQASPVFEEEIKIENAVDMVNKPPHYNQHSIEPITVIEDWNMGYMDGQVLKYISRWRYKNGLEDLKKARWYLDRLIANEEKANQQKNQ